MHTSEREEQARENARAATEHEGCESEHARLTNGIADIHRDLHYASLWLERGMQAIREIEAKAEELLR